MAKGLCYALSASNNCCCVASCSYTELNWKLKDSASFFGLGSRTTVAVDSPSRVSAVTIVSLSSSCLSSGLIRATTRTLMLCMPERSMECARRKGKKYRDTTRANKQSTQPTVTSIRSTGVKATPASRICCPCPFRLESITTATAQERHVLGSSTQTST